MLRDVDEGRRWCVLSRKGVGRRRCRCAALSLAPIAYLDGLVIDLDVLLPLFHLG